MTRRVVITADDFGLDPALTDVIIDLLAQERISATTVITPSPYAGPALATLTAARDQDRLPDGFAPGVHVTMSSDEGLPPFHPLAPDTTSLLDPASGALPLDPDTREPHLDAQEVSRELTAQVDAVGRTGWRPSRIDLHRGVLYGLAGRSFLPELLQVCARRGLGLRLPRILVGPMGGTVPPELQPLHQQAVLEADRLGVPLPQVIATNPRPAGQIASYEELRDFYLNVLENLPQDGISEIYLHPAPDDPDLLRRFPAWRKRVWEARLLRDPVFRDGLARQDIELVPHW